MDGQRRPRPVEPMDLAAPISQARQFLADRDKPGNQGDAAACAILRQLLRHLDAIAAGAGRQFQFDRELIADALQHPGKYREDVRACQAALLRGTLGPDTPMTGALLALPPRHLRQDDGE